MKRVDAIRTLAAHLTGDRLVVSCNGMASRELVTVLDRPEHFYMIGSMGLASSIGLGLALTRPERTVIVLDGDGNVLMNLGTLANVAVAAPASFYHVVLDNGCHDSTGGQPTVSGPVALERVAEAVGYRRVECVETPEALEAALGRLFDAPGPAMLRVRVEPGSIHGIGRVETAPPDLARRFRAAAAAEARP